MVTYKRFAALGVHVQSWYPVCKSSQVGFSKPRTMDWLDRRVVLFRDRRGLHCLDADCPHLGADLGQGSLTPQGLRCAFHGWCFDAEGACTAAPGSAKAPQRRTRNYPVVEHWGMVWAFNGPKPLFPFPAELGEQCSRLHLPRQRGVQHPHILAANGLDLPHFSALHGLDIQAHALSQPDKFSTELFIRGRPQGAFWRAFTGSLREPIQARFRTLGGNMSIGRIEAPFQSRLFFAGSTLTDGTHTLELYIFLPPGNGWRLAFALGVALALLPDDDRLMKRLRFRPDFGPGDGELRAFAGQLERLPAY